MLNLLPQEEKDRVVAGYRMRLAIVAAIFTSALFAVAAVGLLPAYVSERAETNVLIKAQQDADQRNTAESLAEAKKLEASNKVLADYLEARTALIGTSLTASSVIERVLAKRGTEISVLHIEVASNLVEISGVARTRAGLIAFLESLKADSDFKTAVLPISDLAKSTEATFTIQISLP
jgi:Tfp pilus assembly protein PilN